MNRRSSGDTQAALSEMAQAEFSSWYSGIEERARKQRMLRSNRGPLVILQPDGTPDEVVDPVVHFFRREETGRLGTERAEAQWRQFILLSSAMQQRRRPASAVVAAAATAAPAKFSSSLELDRRLRPFVELLDSEQQRRNQMDASEFAWRSEVFQLWQYQRQQLEQTVLRYRTAEARVQRVTRVVGSFAAHEQALRSEIAAARDGWMNSLKVREEHGRAALFASVTQRRKWSVAQQPAQHALIACEERARQQILSSEFQFVRNLCDQLQHALAASQQQRCVHVQQGLQRWYSSVVAVFEQEHSLRHALCVSEQVWRQELHQTFLVAVAQQNTRERQQVALRKRSVEDWIGAVTRLLSDESDTRGHIERARLQWSLEFAAVQCNELKQKSRDVISAATAAADAVSKRLASLVQAEDEQRAALEYNRLRWMRHLDSQLRYEAIQAPMLYARRFPQQLPDPVLERIFRLIDDEIRIRHDIETGEVLWRRTVTERYVTNLSRMQDHKTQAWNSLLSDEAVIRAQVVASEKKWFKFLMDSVAAQREKIRINAANKKSGKQRPTAPFVPDP